MDYEEIFEKIEGAKTYKEMRSLLSDEELALFAAHEVNYDEEFDEKDECLVKDILLLLKASRHSARHSFVVLEKVKDALLLLSFPLH